MDAVSLVTDAVVDEYSRDGVVCLRGAIESRWIDLLRAGVERNIAAPGERGRVWSNDGDGQAMRYDSQSWLRVPEYKSFILESPMAEIAGRVMAASAVNFFFDALFHRTAGNQFRTPFHQDEPFWSVEGFDTCSAWMPLVPVAKQSALECVAGSHRWNERYLQTNFGELTGDPRDQVVYTDAEDRVPFPDIEGERERYDIRSWDMEPGDVVLFNGRTIHGGSGNLAEGRELRVFNTKWLGDDVRVIFREEGMDPDHSAVMTAAGLAPGDRVSDPLYPEVWRR
jgi:ectoine hydroxylase-related dioxygenase (phytanoyl-CoA dioxygenase family)